MYAKVINEETKECQVGLGTNVAFYQSIGMVEMDAEQCTWNGRWYLTGYVPEKPEPSKEEKIKQLKIELAEIDEKSMRSVRAKLAGTATDEDLQFLAQLETQAEQKRQEIKDLEQGE